jgi:hypothetical protein
MKRKLLSIIFWGALWGIAEATLGNIIHLASIALPGLPGFVMFPVAFYFMRRVYLEVDDPKAVFFASVIAASIKMVDFLLPGYIAIRIINPALSILMEGLAVALAFTYCRQRGKEFGFFEGFGTGVFWRGLWLGYMFAISLINLPAELVTSGAPVALRFLLLESLVNAVLIFAMLKIFSRFDTVERKPGIAFAALMTALMIQAAI